MKPLFNCILHGGDYNPNQWEKPIWQEDLRLFELANINSATINVFSWAKLQPSEEVYDFSTLDEIVTMLSDANVQIVMATSTGAMPAWMSKRYPEVNRTDFEGHSHKFGQRHNACPNSLVYRKYATKLASLLAQRYANSKAIVCWHVNNEYGGECYCENCEKEFRVWLKNRYKTLDAVNKAWNTEFWGHTFYDWDEIVLPNALSDGIDYRNTAFAGISIDYRRFNSDSILSNYVMERDAIREYHKQTPITTNLMGTYKYLDYFKWAKEMDVISWDNYPAYDTPWSMVAMCHDLMRGLKKQSFMLMEQTPSQQNWQAYNSLKRPGQMRAQSYQTIAHGADTIQYFQLRRSVGGCEKFHGAVIEHVGHENTRVFKEVAQLGAELNKLSPYILGAENNSKVGIVFDWENYWALEYTSGPSVDLTYVEQIHQYYNYFYKNNIPVDIVSIDDDFKGYSLIVAPVLYMCKNGLQERLESFTQNGGTFVTTFMSGIVNESDNVHLGGYPGPLRNLAGIWVEEIDALAKEKTNGIKMANGADYTCNMLCDIIHLETATSLANYTSDFYANTPAVTKNAFGKGEVYYVGTQLEEKALSEILSMACENARVASIVEEKTLLEVTKRTQGEKTYTFIINFQATSQGLPKQFCNKADMLTGQMLKAETILEPFTAFCVEE